MKTYFITGATGAIGSALLPQLLADSEANAILLLRADSEDNLIQRLEQLYRFWEIPAQDPRRSRVRAVAGDVTLPSFGLSEREYARIAQTTTHMIHSAGNVRMNLPIEKARVSSVNSAKEVIGLARNACQVQKVEFVSTVGVGGRTHGTVPEYWITEQRDFHNTYEQAKAEAEGIVRNAVESGLPITVHRPSMVVGDTETGRIVHFQVFYHLCEFLSGARTLGLAPDFGRARLDIIPADYVARLIAWSSNTRETTGKILHACSGPDLALPLPKLRDIVRSTFSAHGRKLPREIKLPTAVFRGVLSAASLFMPPDVRRAIRTLPVFLDYLATEQTFGNSTTQAIATTAGLPLPTPDQYLTKILAYYLARAKQ